MTQALKALALSPEAIQRFQSEGAIGSRERPVDESVDPKHREWTANWRRKNPEEAKRQSREAQRRYRERQGGRIHRIPAEISMA